MEIGYESTIKTWINTAAPDVNAFRSRLAVGGFNLSKSIRNTASIRASPNEGVMNGPTGFVILSAPFLILDQPNPNPGWSQCDPICPNWLCSLHRYRYLLFGCVAMVSTVYPPKL
jgi:hypothetical protein